MTLAIVVLVAAGALVSAPPAGARTAARDSHTAGAARAGDLVARQLARRVTRARGTAARADAVLAAMRALRLPVVSTRGRGRSLSRGAREVPRSFTLYDFEISAVAQALGKGQTRSLEDVSKLLFDAKLRDGTEAFTPAQLRGALVDSVRSSARNPRRQRSLVPLLINELARRQRKPYDLRRAPGVARIRLDALQTLLVVADIVLPSVARRRSPAAPVARSAQAARQAPCAGTSARVPDPDLPFGDVVEKLNQRAGQILKGITSALDLIHGSMLAFSVRVDSLGPEVRDTHYGPAGHAEKAGEPLTFQTRVVMEHDLGDFVVNCGRFVGMKFPKKGPIPGVRIVWVTADLERHGTVALDPTSSETDAQGVATLIFTPRDEAGPAGQGLSKLERGRLDGFALYQSAFENIPGTIAQFLTPKLAGFIYAIERHDELKLHLDMDATVSVELDIGTVRYVTRVSGLPITHIGIPPGQSNGSQKLDLREFSFTPAPRDGRCTHPSAIPSPESPFSFPLSIQRFTIDAVPGATPVVRMVVFPGEIITRFIFRCPDSPDNLVGRGSLYAGWAPALGGRAGDAGVAVEDWEVVNGVDLFAQKTISGTSTSPGSGTINVDARFVLRRVGQ